LRQVIESVNETFKGQLDLERHGGHTPAGVIVRESRNERVLATRETYDFRRSGGGILRPMSM
jgi:hypothetical protein